MDNENPIRIVSNWKWEISWNASSRADPDSWTWIWTLLHSTASSIWWMQPRSPRIFQTIWLSPGWAVAGDFSDYGRSRASTYSFEMLFRCLWKFSKNLFVRMLFCEKWIDCMMHLWPISPPPPSHRFLPVKRKTSVPCDSVTISLFYANETLFNESF